MSSDKWFKLIFHVCSFSFSEFFENLAFEAKIDSEKSVMIKNSIHARKAIVRRARTMRFEASRKRRSKGDSSPLFEFFWMTVLRLNL